MSTWLESKGKFKAGSSPSGARRDSISTPFWIAFLIALFDKMPCLVLKKAKTPEERAVWRSMIELSMRSASVGRSSAVAVTEPLLIAAIMSSEFKKACTTKVSR